MKPYYEHAGITDAIEDHPELRDDLRSRVTTETWDALILLTRTPPYDYMSYIRNIGRSGNRLAMEVKIADLCDHLRLGCPENLVTRYTEALNILHHFYYQHPANTEAVK